MNKKKALGRGLSSFLSDNIKDINLNQIQKENHSKELGVIIIPIENIKPNPNQPRKYFNSEDLNELSETIKDKGILQPLIVVKEGLSEYKIVAGERRWRAAQLARLHEVPAIVKDLTSEEIIEIAIIENVQRSELSPLEEAEGYLNLVEKFKYKHEKIAKIVGKSRPYISNSIRLLSLPKEVMNHIKKGNISSGHARALLNCKDPIALSRLIVRKGLSVRQTEILAKKQKVDFNKVGDKDWFSIVKDPDILDLEKSLTAHIKFSINILYVKKNQSGKVQISYKNLEELDTICEILKSKK